MRNATPLASSPVGPRLTALAYQVDSLTVDRRDPKRFFLARFEIVAELHRLARAVETSA